MHTQSFGHNTCTFKGTAKCFARNFLSTPLPRFLSQFPPAHYIFYSIFPPTFACSSMSRIFWPRWQARLRSKPPFALITLYRRCPSCKFEEKYSTTPGSPRCPKFSDFTRAKKLGLLSSSALLTSIHLVYLLFVSFHPMLYKWNIFGNSFFSLDHDAVRWMDSHFVTLWGVIMDGTERERDRRQSKITTEIFPINFDPRQINAMPELDVYV